MKKLLLIFIFLLISTIVNAANHYILDGGTGSGTSWSDALDDLPATLVRGDTYYIGDGTYSGYTFDDSASGTTLITIKKATQADHGTDTGWSSTYGDGAANFGPLVFTTSYWLFDGQAGGGPNNWNVGYGFTVYSTSSVLITLSGTISNITIKHTKIYSNRGTTAIAGIKGTTGACDNIIVSYCEISNVFGPVFHINNWTNSIIEYSYLYANKSTAAEHAEGISSIGTNENITIRHNLWDSIEGTAVIAGVNFGTSDNWQIYGNIFSRSVTTIYYYWEDPGTNQNKMQNSEFFNNTIVTISGLSQGSIIIQNGSNNTAYNNIWYNNDANSFTNNMTHDYSYADLNIRTEGCSPPCDKDPEVISGESHGWKDGGSPFVNYNSDPLLADLTPTSGFFDTNPGYDTGSLISGNDVDMFGTTRGADGVWDFGAIEYGSDAVHSINLIGGSHSITIGSGSHSLSF